MCWSWYVSRAAQSSVLELGASGPTTTSWWNIGIVMISGGLLYTTSIWSDGFPEQFRREGHITAGRKWGGIAFGTGEVSFCASAIDDMSISWLWAWPPAKTRLTIERQSSQPNDPCRKRMELRMHVFWTKRLKRKVNQDWCQPRSL